MGRPHVTILAALFVILVVSVTWNQMQLLKSSQDLVLFVPQDSDQPQNSCLKAFEQSLNNSRQMRAARKKYMETLEYKQINVFDAWEPEIDCLVRRRVGKLYGDGGKWVCSPDIPANPRNLVYSFGSRFDISFEQGVRAYMPSVEIHTFDPTCLQTDERWPLFSQRLEETNVSFHALGLQGGSENAVSQSVKQETMKSFPELVKYLGHSGRRVRIFKIDCEGCEYLAFKHIFPMVKRGELVIDQIQIEMHAGSASTSRYHRIAEWFSAAEDAGYFIFHKERNHWGCDGYRCVEFSLIHQSFALDSSCPSLDHYITSVGSRNG